MTYVSRRTRIIVSTWLDECDAEYRLRAARKRSDGRLKKYGSCDDFRAWVNNNCIKHEYLSELMSDGEFSGSPPFRLFGRFVPVPVLFQLAQGSKAFEEKESFKKQAVGTRRSESDKTSTKSEFSSNLESSKDVNASDEFRDVLEDGCRDTLEDAERDVLEIHSNTNSVRSEWEKTLLEKNLLQCTDLLDKAMHKLEKICCIVALADEEYEKARNREIEGAFSRSKLSCSCSALTSSNNAVFAPSKSCLNKLRESARCTELLRKISDLRDKLKKVQECRRDVNQQIECTKRRYECASAIQVTELYSRNEHAHVKKLQKKLEKLIAERGKILSEMCQALTSLNNIKKSSKSNMNFYVRKEDSKAKEVDASDYEKCTESACSCGCKSTENSEESVKCRRPGSSSSESYDDDRGYKKRKRISYQFESQSFDGPRTPDSGSDRCRSRQPSFRKSSVENNKYDNGIGSSCNLYDPNRQQQEQEQQQQQQQEQQQQQQQQQQQEQQEDWSKGTKREGSIDKGTNLDKKCRSSKSRAKFVCPTSPCRKQLYAEDVSDFEKSLTQEQLCIVEAAVESFQQQRRPQTSPTTANARDTDKDKDKKTTYKSEKDTDQYNKDIDVHEKDIDTDKIRRGSGSREREPRSLSGIPYPFRGRAGSALDRRAKSETSVKQVQNSLKNYQQRLSAMEGLEDKVEGMRRKLSEGHNLRKNLAKTKAEARKQRDLEREKSEKEISRLSSENWELKKQVQELVAKFSVQSKKMENLKCGAMRARALECQAQELQKELSEYRDGFEHQRKCISKWESVVTAQRTEIENLMNHIRMLTTAKEEEPNPAFQDRKCAQRSKSYSPERYRERKSSTRPKAFSRTPFIRPTSEEDNCYCESFPQPENRRMVPLRGYDRSYYAQGNGFCN